MPRRPRITLPGVPLHLIQRGNNRQACFFHEQDYLFYLEWLAEYAQISACKVHAYVLMTNHVHLLLTPESTHSAGDLMKRLGQRYVQYINRRYRRSGTLWEGRFRSCMTGEEDYLLSCYRYIELNPVRAGIVKHPQDYRWSSYRANALGEASGLIDPHDTYLSLGNDQEKQTSAYRELFTNRLNAELIDQIRKSTNGNYALGSPLFQEEIAGMLGRRVTPGKSGRPGKESEKDRI